MRRSIAAFLAAVLLVVPARAAEIEINDPTNIALAVAISDAVDATTDKVSTCIGEGGAHHGCLCANTDQIAGVRAALDSALAAHPEWAGQALFVADKGDGQSLTLFLDTVAASSTPPDCD